VKVGQFRSLGTVFANNQLIQTFDELELFTGITLFGNHFNGSTLRRFKFPGNITAIDYNSFNGMNAINMDELTVPATVKSIYGPSQRGYVGCWLIDHNLMLGFGYCYGRSVKGSTACVAKITYTGGVIPLSTATNIKGYNKNHYYYVPDELLDQYKAASQYSEFPTRVLPLSEFPD